MSVKGFCDNCGRWSPRLEAEYDEYGGLEGYFCQKCMRELQKAIEKAYVDRARTFGGVAVLYPDERR
mgnify:CR=1 FL=1